MASMRRRKVLCPSRWRGVSGRLLRAWSSWAAARLKAAMVSGSGEVWGSSGGGVAGLVGVGSSAGKGSSVKWGIGGLLWGEVVVGGWLGGLLEESGDLGPALSGGLEDLFLVVFVVLGGLPKVGFADGVDGVLDQLVDDLGCESVQLPAVCAMDLDVVDGAAVGELGWVRWWLVLLDLIEVEGQSVYVDAAHEQLEAVGDISGHVDPGGVVVAEVEDHRYLALVDVVLEALGGAPHLGLAGVATAAEVGDVEAVADSLDDSEECVFLDPAFDSVGLGGPLVDAVAGRGAVDDVGWAVPVAEAAEVPGAVLQVVPVE